jgi:hypothetical protein
MYWASPAHPGISMMVLLSVFVARAVFRIPNSTIHFLSSSSATVLPSLYSAQRKSTKLKSSPCFKGETAGIRPSSRLVFDAAGNLYGTTQLGGGSGCVAGQG